MDEAPALRVEVQLGENKFLVEGTFTFDEHFTNVFRTWVNAQADGVPGAIETIAEDIEGQNARMTAAVDAADGE